MSTAAELSSLMKTAASVRESLLAAAKSTTTKSGHVPQEIHHRLVDLWGREQALLAALEPAHLTAAGLETIRAGLKEQLLELLKFSGELRCLKDNCQQLETALASLGIDQKGGEISKLIEIALR